MRHRLGHAIKHQTNPHAGSEQHGKPAEVAVIGFGLHTAKTHLAQRRDDQAEAEDDELLPLEGRIVAHPHAGRTDIMILVDTKTNIVYSAFSRTDDGDKIELGTVNPDKSISWKLDALGTFLLFVLHLVLCMYRSRHEYPIPRDISGQISC